ncbi:hypothetical protein KUCAC02_019566 [Chaenocephalus aceratus]|uniref:Uncharacterized protein n=1 Tax=Chaenocephalus aceratus TaxID=36190 RepID=A0ACB9VPI3_CHAAC|nr:hypothetical protein KUCAC02_019566 [Chaenocephalus aceratus]
MRHLDDQWEQRRSVQLTKGTPRDGERNSSGQLLRPEEVFQSFLKTTLEPRQRAPAPAHANLDENVALVYGRAHVLVWENQPAVRRHRWLRGRPAVSLITHVTCSSVHSPLGEESMRQPLIHSGGAGEDSYPPAGFIKMPQPSTMRLHCLASLKWPTMAGNQVQDSETHRWE